MLTKESILRSYKEVSKIPSLLAANFGCNGTKISTKWSVRNLDKGKMTKYATGYTVDAHLNVVGQSEFGSDISHELLSSVSPRDTYRACIIEDRDKDGKKKQYLEVWKKTRLVNCIDLTALDLHGDVYADSEFGGLNWAADEAAVVYIAEKKQPKSEPYFKRKAPAEPKNDSGEAPPTQGNEYIYRQDWGEQLNGKVLSQIVICRLESEQLLLLNGLPESWCPGQVQFTPDGKGVVGVAWETEPRRLGLIFCTNRPSHVFYLTLDGKMKELSGPGLAVRSPRLWNNKAVWLQRKAGGPHHACHQLVTANYGKDYDGVTTVIDIVDSQVQTGNGEPFTGIYCQALPLRCFSRDGSRIVFSTPQETAVKSYVVDLNDKTIVELKNKEFDGSLTVLDVNSEVILAVCSNMTTPGQLFAAHLPSKGKEGEIVWKRISEPIELPDLISQATVQTLSLEHPDCQDPVKSFTAIYMSPNDHSDKRPLLVWPHGGPHSNFVNSYSLEAAFYAMLGFATLQVNYRGSTGAGQASVDFLPKHIGWADVRDCKYATDVACQRYEIDNTRMGLTGGSHGGFLVTHLSGQYPDLYKAVVTRNPVIDVASMINSTDIADWSNLVLCHWNFFIARECIFSAEELRLDAVTSIIWFKGLASVRINFRGSSGHGDRSLRTLLGHVGSYDVQDCLLALTTLLEREETLDDHKVLLYGGSYGGFVTAQLAGQYPDRFVAMVMRNPLIDLATKGQMADNSEGCAVEAGFEFTEAGAASEDQLLSMRRCSPLAHVHKVTAPTALLLGAGDKRVPHHQGLEYCRRLKANGVVTKLYMYEDNHSLSSLPVEVDHLINGAEWFSVHLR